MIVALEILHPVAIDCIYPTFIDLFVQLSQMAAYGHANSKPTVLFGTAPLASKGM